MAHYVCGFKDRNGTFHETEVEAVRADLKIELKNLVEDSVKRLHERYSNHYYEYSGYNTEGGVRIVIDEIIKDPTEILHLLEQLKAKTALIPEQELEETLNSINTTKKRWWKF